MTSNTTNRKAANAAKGRKVKNRFATFSKPSILFLCALRLRQIQQLAEWRAEMAAKSEPTTKSTTEDTAFYAGKPYVESTGGCAFIYRSYNPEMARWTSEGPSGFSDGANGNIYAPTPTRALDPTQPL